MPKIGTHFYMNARGCHAEAIIDKDGFLVLEGSEVRDYWSSYLRPPLVEYRRRCLTDGTIKNWKLTQNMLFDSSSAASYFLLGAQTSGPSTWRDENGHSLMQYEKVEKGIIPSLDREYTAFFKVVGGNEGSKCYYPARLDTYGCGCSHECKYCYAKSELTFYGNWNPKEPSIADINRIETKVKKLPKGTVVRLGGLTDCFQPCELIYRTTYKTIQLLNKYGISYLIVTKSHIVANDEYVKIMDRQLAHIQISITTTDDELSLTYEKASVPSKRIAAIEKLSSLGFDTHIRLSPFIEGYVDFEILNNIKCDKILVEFLRVNPEIRKCFDIDYSDYVLPQEGFLHLPLEKKVAMLSNIRSEKVISVCEDYTEHYDYWKNHFNPNPSDCCNLRQRKES